MVNRRRTASATAPLEERAFIQKRAARSYELLLAAAETVFVRLGFDGAQTPEIAAEAGVATGTFYRYFRDKRHAFLEVMRCHMLHARDKTQIRRERFVGTDIRGALDVILDVVFTDLRRNKALYRILLSMSLHDLEAERLRAEFEAEEREQLAAIIAQIIPAADIPDPHAAALVIQIAVLEVAAERAGIRPRRGTRPVNQQIEWALREMIYRFLFPGRP